MTTDIERGGIDVSGPHEPSYYEVALTNRQVVVAFVILLTCLVAAFLAGVWIGRESAARAQEKLALLSHPAVSGGPPSAGGGDKERSEGQALQEFQFFADPRHRPAGAKPSAAAGALLPATPPTSPPPRTSATRPTATTAQTPPNTAAEGASEAAPDAASTRSSGTSTMADDLRHRRRAAAAANQAGEGEPMAGTTPAPKPASSGADFVRPRLLPEAADRFAAGAAPPGKPRTSREGRAASAGAGTAAATSSAGAGDLVIQVFSSADKEQADKVRDRLVNAGLPAFLSPIAKNTQTMYRVRIGPFPSRAAADTAAEKVRREHKLDTWITPK